MKNKVAVLLGGNSSERNISIKSGHSILNSLLKSGINAYPIDPQHFPIMQLKTEGFSKAYIALHGRGGEDGVIQGVLEYLKIPYTGSGILASSLSLDKYKTKLMWKSFELPVLPDIYLQKNDILKFLHHGIEKKFLKLKFPILVKPNTAGSSIGITLVNSFNELNQAIRIAYNYSHDILIEKFLVGEEYTISILGKKVLPSIKITTKNYFYDYNAKYKCSSTQYLCPSGLSDEKEKELQKIAKLAWNTLGCKGCGRIDVILDKKDKFWLLEVNTIPGMTNKSLVPIAARAFKIPFDDLVLKILNDK